MTNAGNILREARIASRKTITDISETTKIKEKFLEALETSCWEVLPNFSIAQGFARNFAQAVGVSPELVVALLRRDFPQTQITQIREGVSLKPQSIWTPATTLMVVVAATLILLGAYLGNQYMQFAAPPALQVRGVEAKDGALLVSGFTSPNATVEVNGRKVLVDSDGNFRVEIQEYELMNSQIQIQAVSRSGKKTVVSKKID